jgi:polar amino acid transport system substrate-binding protein
MRHSRLATLGVTLLLTMSVAACGRSGGMEGEEVAADCKPEHEVDTVDSGKLTVGVTEIPPFSYTEGGSPAGLDYDIVTQFAERNCLQVIAEPVTYAAAVPSVKSGRIDLTIGDWYRTAERAEIVGLTAPIYTDELSLTSKNGTDSIQGLVGQSVGTVDGYLWVEDLRALLGDDLHVYPSSAELKQDVEAGRLDVAVDAYGSALYTFDDSYTVTTVEPDPAVAATQEPAQVTFPYTPDNTGLGEALDAHIAELHQSGELVQILESYDLPASAAEVGKPRLIS